MKLLCFSFLIFACFLASSEAYKVLFFIPTFGVSHIRFSGRLADIIADAGHEVHVYQPIVDNTINITGYTPSKIAKAFTLPKNEGDYPSFDVNEQNAYWEGMPFSSVGNLGQCKADVCKAVLNDNANLEQLRAENYDLAVTEYFEPCGYGLIKALGIRKHVTTWSGGLNNGLTAIFGIKVHLSYSPGFMALASEKMSFFERVTNVFHHFLETKAFWPVMFGPVERVIQKEFPDFTIQKSIADSAFVFVNSEEHVDYTIPITPKVIRIPNIDNDKPKPLTGKFAEIVESPKYRGFVLFSFGSVVQSSTMPARVKTAFLEAFKEFPDVAFFWKYEKPEDGTASDIPNVFIDKWLPQRDLLYHPKILAFITHGGQNSLNEAAATGVPLLSLPVFADQPRNTVLIKYRGLGLGLDHNKITKKKAVEALREILNNKKYKENAQTMSRMIQARLLPTKESFIKHVEFAAEFGDSGTLSAEGANQGTIVLYSLDVIAFLIAVAFFILLLLKWSLIALYNWIRTKLTKPKKE